MSIYKKSIKLAYLLRHDKDYAYINSTVGVEEDIVVMDESPVELIEE